MVFLETCKQLKKQRHMIIECIPLPKEIGDMSPIYFKVKLQSGIRLLEGSYLSIRVEG